MQFEGDLRKRETAVEPQNYPDITNRAEKNEPYIGVTNRAEKNEPYIGVTSLGTPVVYKGNNKKYQESKANQNAELTLRAMSRGITGDTSISLNTKTGNIKISAPKAIIKSKTGQRLFNSDTLKALSQAYK